MSPLGEERRELRQRFESIVSEFGITFRPTDSPDVWDLGLPPATTILRSMRQKTGVILLFGRAVVFLLFLMVLMTSLGGPGLKYPPHDALESWSSVVSKPFPQNIIEFYFGYPTVSIVILVLSLFSIYLDAIVLWSGWKELLKRVWVWYAITVSATLTGGVLLGTMTDIVLTRFFAGSSEIVFLWLAVLTFYAVALSIGELTLLRRFVHCCAPAEHYQLGQKVRVVRRYLYSARPQRALRGQEPHTAALHRAYSKLKLDVLGCETVVFLVGLFSVLMIQRLLGIRAGSDWVLVTAPVTVLSLPLLTATTVFWATSVKKRELDVHLAFTSLLFVIVLCCTFLSNVPFGLEFTIGFQVFGLVCLAYLLEVTRRHMKERPTILGRFYYRALLDQLEPDEAYDFVDEVYREYAEFLKSTHPGS